MNQTVDRYPLAWPAGWTRTPWRDRERAHFSRHETTRDNLGQKVQSSRRVTIADAFDRLDAQLTYLGAARVIVSSNLELRVNGVPRSNQIEPPDPGIALYFTLKGKPLCLACDKWDRAADNIAAIAQHIDALRRIDRYGIGSIEQAFAGYTAIPAQAASWFTVLEFDAPPKVWDVIEQRHTELAKRHHPDRGGNPETMAKINAARDTARLEFGL